MTHGEAFRIFRRIEAGADQVSLLQAAEARARRKVIARLYSPVPWPVLREYSRIELEARKAREVRALEAKRLLETVANDPAASDESRRLARIALATPPALDDDFDDPQRDFCMRGGEIEDLVQ
jgi:hypothetical protein